MKSVLRMVVSSKCIYSFSQRMISGVTLFSMICASLIFYPDNTQAQSLSQNNRTTIQNQHLRYAPIQKIGQACYQSFAGDERGQMMVSQLFDLQGKRPSTSGFNLKDQGDAISEKNFFHRVLDISFKHNLYQWKRNKQMFQNDTGNLPISLHSDQLRQSYNEVENILKASDVPNLSTDRSRVQEAKYFNQVIQSINQMCRVANASYRGLLKIYQTKALQDPILHPENQWIFNSQNQQGLASAKQLNQSVVQKISEEEKERIRNDVNHLISQTKKNSVESVMTDQKNPVALAPNAPSGIWGSKDETLRKQMKEVRELASSEGSFLQDILLHSNLGIYWATPTSLQSRVKAWNRQACVEQGFQLTPLPENPQELSSLINASVGQVEIFYQKESNRILNDFQKPVRDALPAYIEHAPFAIRDALIATPNIVDANLICSAVHQIRSEQDVREEVSRWQSIVLAPLSMVRLAFGVAIGAYWALRSSNELIQMGKNEDRIIQSIASNTIAPLYAQSLMASIQSQRPFSRLNLVLSGVMVVGGLKAIRSDVLRNRALYDYMAVQGGATESQFAKATDIFSKWRRLDPQPPHGGYAKIASADKMGVKLSFNPLTKNVRSEALDDLLQQINTKSAPPSNDGGGFTGFDRTGGVKSTTLAPKNKTVSPQIVRNPSVHPLSTVHNQGVLNLVMKSVSKTADPISQTVQPLIPSLQNYSATISTSSNLTTTQVLAESPHEEFEKLSLDEKAKAVIFGKLIPYDYEILRKICELKKSKDASVSAAAIIFARKHHFSCEDASVSIDALNDVLQGKSVDDLQLLRKMRDMINRHVDQLINNTGSPISFTDIEPLFIDRNFFQISNDVYTARKFASVQRFHLARDFSNLDMKQMQDKVFVELQSSRLIQLSNEVWIVPYGLSMEYLKKSIFHLGEATVKSIVFDNQDTSPLRDIAYLKLVLRNIENQIESLEQKSASSTKRNPIGYQAIPTDLMSIIPPTDMYGTILNISSWSVGDQQTKINIGNLPRRFNETISSDPNNDIFKFPYKWSTKNKKPKDLPSLRESSQDLNSLHLIQEDRVSKAKDLLLNGGVYDPMYKHEFCYLRDHDQNMRVRLEAKNLLDRIGVQCPTGIPYTSGTLSDGTQQEGPRPPEFVKQRTGGPRVVGDILGSIVSQFWVNGRPLKSYLQKVNPVIINAGIGVLNEKENEIFQKFIQEKVSYQDIVQNSAIKDRYRFNTRLVTFEDQSEYYVVTEDSTGEDSVLKNRVDPKKEYASYYIDQKLFKRYPPSILVQMDGKYVFIFKKEPNELKFNLTLGGKEYKDLTIVESRDLIVPYLQKINIKPGSRFYNMMIKNDIVQIDLPQDVLISDLLIGFSERNFYENTFVNQCGDRSIVDVTLKDFPFSKIGTICNIQVMDGRQSFLFNLRERLGTPYKQWLPVFLSRYSRQFHHEQNPRQWIQEVLSKNLAYISNIALWPEIQIRKDLGEYLNASDLNTLIDNRKTLLTLIAEENPDYAPYVRSSKNENLLHRHIERILRDEDQFYLNDKLVVEMDQMLKEGTTFSAQIHDWLQKKLGNNGSLLATFKKGALYPVRTNPSNVTLGKVIAIQWMAQYIDDADPLKKQTQDWLNEHQGIDLELIQKNRETHDWILNHMGGYSRDQKKWHTSGKENISDFVIPTLEKDLIPSAFGKINCRGQAIAADFWLNGGACSALPDWANIYLYSPLKTRAVSHDIDQSPEDLRIYFRSAYQAGVFYGSNVEKFLTDETAYQRLMSLPDKGTGIIYNGPHTLNVRKEGHRLVFYDFQTGTVTARTEAIFFIIFGKHANNELIFVETTKYHQTHRTQENGKAYWDMIGQPNSIERANSFYH